MRHFVALFPIFTAIFAASSAPAQIVLPRLDVPLNTRLLPLEINTLKEPLNRLLAKGDVNKILNRQDLRLKQIQDLLASQPDRLEINIQGELVVKDEILAWSPTETSRDAAQKIGLIVLRQQILEGLDQTLLVFGKGESTKSTDTMALLSRLRQLDPGGVYDFNHLYTESADNIFHAADAEAVEGPPPNMSARAASSTKAKDRVKVGLIDGGVNAKHSVFEDVHIHTMPCQGDLKPSLHGTAVAALIAGQSAHFSSVLETADLYAADLYCNAGGYASIEYLNAALAWMVKQKVAVINISFVGPPNQSLERIVRSLVERGHLLVAAVGNDGPVAPPLFPASYPGVVGVTGVDHRGRVLPEAGRGAQVMFAAPGSQMVSANLDRPPYRQVRGTSFATPIVAAMLANKLQTPDPNLAQFALQELIKEAQAGHQKLQSTEIGYGIVGMRFRVAPQAFQ